jgi:hypothetical protein
VRVSSRPGGEDGGGLRRKRNKRFAIARVGVRSFRSANSLAEADDGGEVEDDLKGESHTSRA